MEHKALYDEKKLLENVAIGNETAFRHLYKLHHQRIYSFARFLTHSEVLAEEVTQEIFIKIWEHRAELSEIRQFDAWLKTIVRNQCYTYLNRLAKERMILRELNNTKVSNPEIFNPGMSRQNFSNQEFKSSEDTEERVIFNEYYHLLQKALRTLPEQQRKVFILSRQEGIKHEEIARQMGLSINTIKSHMKAALKKMRLIIGAQTLGLMAVIGRALLG